MKKLALFLFVLFPVAACAQDVQPTTDGQPAAMDEAQRNQMLYSLGFLIGENLNRQLILDNENDFKAVSQGMRDSLLGKQPQTDLDQYKKAIIEKYETDAKLLAQKFQAKQNEYLENFKKEKGVKTLDNGALIKLTKNGKGKAPKADNRVKVHYTGTLIDGTKFDSSRDRGEAASFQLSQVIPCWTKGLQQMKPGSQAKLVCPADTAYGNRPAGPIPPNSVLVFDVELLGIE